MLLKGNRGVVEIALDQQMNNLSSQVDCIYYSFRQSCINRDDFIFFLMSGIMLNDAGVLFYLILIVIVS